MRPLPSVKDLIKDNTVYFNRYRNHIFYYRLSYCDQAPTHENGGIGLYREFEFPVPSPESEGSEGKQADLTKITLHADDKAIYFMRYINRAIKDGTFLCIDPSENKPKCPEPLLCESCHRAQATVHLTEIKSGELSKHDYCEPCAVKLGIDLKEGFSVEELGKGL